MANHAWRQPCQTQDVCQTCMRRLVYILCPVWPIQQVSNKIKHSLTIVIAYFDHIFIDCKGALIRLKGICELLLKKVTEWVRG